MDLENTNEGARCDEEEELINRLIGTPRTKAERAALELELEKSGETGSVVGSAALIAGTTVGAGVLALPAATKAVGYIPSSTIIVICWLYACTTGLLVAEVNIRTTRELGGARVSLLSMSKHTLGKTGLVLASLTYLFLHYALLVAYVARGGEILSSLIGTTPAMACAAFTALVGTMVYSAPQKALDQMNSILVAAIVLFFLGVVAVAFTKIQLTALFDVHLSNTLSCVPVVALAFVFHNIIPVVVTNLDRDEDKIRKSSR